jgi:hypothetical protein
MLAYPNPDLIKFAGRSSWLSKSRILNDIKYSHLTPHARNVLTSIDLAGETSGAQGSGLQLGGKEDMLPLPAWSSIP